MLKQSRLAEIGALIGDPGRANMLDALMDGRALTARELAAAAGVAPRRDAIATIGSPPQRLRACWKASHTLLPAPMADREPAPYVRGRATPRCAWREPATTTLRDGLGLASPTPCWPAARSNWIRTAAR